jgi:hypothetical protein
VVTVGAVVVPVVGLEVCSVLPVTVVPSPGSGAVVLHEDKINATTIRVARRSISVLFNFTPPYYSETTAIKLFFLTP